MSVKSYSDQKVIYLTVLLLVVEVVWLLMHIGFIPSDFSQKYKSQTEVPAGKVLSIRNNLKMRSQQSLIWEDATTEQTLFFYDSVLTLSQAQATLMLGQGTELHLSENTLVTIEPQLAESNSEIRLRFSKGDLRARSGDRKTQIAANEWTINLDSQSEIALKQTGKDNFEIDVLKGQLNLEQQGEVQAISQNQIVSISDGNKISTVSKEASLELEGPQFQRIYTHGEIAETKIEWTGGADEIQIISQEFGLREIPIETALTEQKLPLAHGKYSLRIAKGDKVSSAHELEIWKAPELQLLSPFSRDRVQTAKPITFMWSEVPQAHEYIVEFKDLNTGEVRREKVNLNYLEKTFDNEGELAWSVIAIDKDGFQIPPAYHQTIFLNHELLQAPKLKTPSIRAPATKPRVPQSLPQKKSKPSGAVLPAWFKIVAKIFIGESASAEDSVEAVFSWEAVPAATGYTIEISATADFRKPAVYQKVRKTEYIWSNFADGTYYWRVAANGANGRMGLFSEAAKIVLSRSQAIDSLDPENVQNEGVLIRKKMDPDKDRAPIETKSEQIFQEAPKAQFDEKRFDEKVKLASEDSRELVESYKILWQPTSAQWTLTGKDQLKANLKGTSNSSFNFQIEQKYTENKSYLIEAYYAQYKWKAADLTTYPFQTDQNFVDAKVQILFGDSKSHLLRGAMVMMIPYIQRADLEKIEIKQTLAVGPSVLYQYERAQRWILSHQLGLVAGSASVAVTTKNSANYRLYKGDSLSALLGVSAQADLIFHDRNFSQGYSAGINLGFSFP